MPNVFSQKVQNGIETAPLRATVALVAIAWLLTACSASEIPGLYRIDIQQGNVVTQDMLAQLEPGMDKRRVKFVLGTPLVADTFNDDRWDYIYTYKTGTDQRMQRNITVFFEGGRLAKLDGDVERAVLRPKKTPVRHDTIVKVKGPREERGFLASLNPFSSSPPRGESDADSAASEEKTADEAGARDAVENEQDRLSKAADALPQDADTRDADTVVTPTGDERQREPSPLSPVNAVDNRTDEDERAPLTEAAAAPRADERTSPDEEPSKAPSEDDGPSWWERVKQRVTGSDSDTRDNESGVDASAAPPPRDTAALQPTATENQTPQASAEPDAKPISVTEAPPAPPSDEASDAPAPAAAADGDGGFFARIRDRFKIPELPPLPSVESPEDFNPDTGDP